MSQDKNLFTNPKDKVMDSNEEAVTENSWRKLNAFTDARVGLGRSGISVPTSHLLAFQLAHAQAIDAVHTQLDTDQLTKTLMEQDWAPDCAPLILHSRATDRATYLQRPDYGRRLNDESAAMLDEHTAKHTHKAQYDLAIAVVDGLSSLAIEQNTIPFLNALSNYLTKDKTPQDKAKDNWNIAPICIVQQGRVAIGDDICQRLKAKCVLVLIGERPGLSSPDSLGLYLTWEGKTGLTDASRNCISNIRPAGLVYQEAARKAFYLLNEARTLKLSGVKLKDRSDDDLVLNESTESHNFLTN